MTISSLSGLPVMVPVAPLTVTPLMHAVASPLTAPTSPAASSATAPTPSAIVILSGATTAPIPAVYSLQPVKATPAWQAATLDIKTTSGQALTLALQDDGSFSIRSGNGESLSDAESMAITKLSDAFKAALDGVAGSPPRLNLAALAQVDTSVLSSVHLTVQASGENQTVQTLDFTADATSRSVKVDGALGKIDVNVDLSSPAITGSKNQQAVAINNFLKQIDQAASRGLADPTLMAMFKDAFTQMNAPAGLDATTTTRSSSWLNETDHALLSGLADFSASITQTATAPNPYRSNEHDAFSFQVSQSTQTSGRNASERGVTQTSSSQLHASFHSALSADAVLNLTNDPKSQNYYYSVIDDSAKSTMTIGYQKGRLVQANLSSTASQSTERSKYIMGQKVEDLITPLKKSQQRDLLPLLSEMERHPPQTTKERDARERDLATLHDSLIFQTNPVALG